MADKEDPIKKEIKCECNKNCSAGLIISKYPENKIKIQIFDKESIKTVVINKNKLLGKINEIKDKP